MRATLLTQRKERPDLHPLGTQALSRHDRASRSYPASRHKGQVNSLRHSWYQRQRRRLLTTVVTASLKALSNHRIDTRLLAFDRKLRTADHVHHLDTVLMEERGKALGTTRRGNYDRHLLLDNDLDQRVNLRIEQWHINPKRSIRSLTAAGYMSA